MKTFNLVAGLATLSLALNAVAGSTIQQLLDQQGLAGVCSIKNYSNVKDPQTVHSASMKLVKHIESGNQNSYEFYELDFSVNVGEGKIAATSFYCLAPEGRLICENALNYEQKVGLIIGKRSVMMLNDRKDLSRVIDLKTKDGELVKLFGVPGGDDKFNFDQKMRDCGKYWRPL